MKSLLIVLIGVFIFAPVSEAKKRKKKKVDVLHGSLGNGWLWLGLACNEKK